MNTSFSPAIVYNVLLCFVCNKKIFLTCLHVSTLTGDVFSGVGPLAISAARIVKRVFANDLNPYAVEYLERNCVLNKLDRKIKVWLLVEYFV